VTDRDQDGGRSTRRFRHGGAFSVSICRESLKGVVKFLVPTIPFGQLGNTRRVQAPGQGVGPTGERNPSCTHVREEERTINISGTGSSGRPEAAPVLDGFEASTSLEEPCEEAGCRCCGAPAVNAVRDRRYQALPMPGSAPSRTLFLVRIDQLYPDQGGGDGRPSSVTIEPGISGRQWRESESCHGD